LQSLKNVYPNRVITVVIKNGKTAIFPIFGCCFMHFFNDFEISVNLAVFKTLAENIKKFKFLRIYSTLKQNEGRTSQIIGRMSFGCSRASKYLRTSVFLFQRFACTVLQKI
jgi:hypothetical protein